MGLSRFSAKMAKIVKKWQSQKILVEKIFLVGIDSECFKTYFQPKISKSKIFSCVKFFCSDSRFSAKMAKIVKKWLSQKILVGIDSECFKTSFKPKISKSKIFSCVKFFLGLCRFSARMAKKVKKWVRRVSLLYRRRRSFQFRARLPKHGLQPSSSYIYEFQEELPLFWCKTHPWESCQNFLPQRMVKIT